MPKALIYYHPSLYQDDNLSQISANSDVAFNNIYATYQRRAYKLAFTFNISKPEFKKLITQNCFYCNAKPSNKKTVRGYSFTYNGLDRLDNTKPYTTDNVVPSCKVCNFMKGTLDLHDFLNKVAAISHHSIRDNLPRQYPKY